MAKLRLFSGVVLQYGAIIMYDMGINAQQFKNIDFSNVFC